MSDRITVADLEAVCRRINRTVNGIDTIAPWTRENGDLRANIGVFHLSGAYGGYSLHRMVNESGGVTDVFGAGHMPKRELYDRMQAYLRGVCDGVTAAR